MIRQATPNDVPAIAQLIRELAIYEKLEHEVKIEPPRLREHLFGQRRFCEALIAEDDATHQPVGFALFFHNYSTFLSKPGIFLEDLFVLPDHRGRGHGKSLLRKLASLALERGCGRVEWAVLDWNAPSIAFYQSLGAKPLDDWTTYRMTGDAIRSLANHKD